MFAAQTIGAKPERFAMNTPDKNMAKSDARGFRPASQALPVPPMPRSESKGSQRVKKSTKAEPVSTLCSGTGRDKKIEKIRKVDRVQKTCKCMVRIDNESKMTFDADIRTRSNRYSKEVLDRWRRCVRPATKNCSRCKVDYCINHGVTLMRTHDSICMD